MTDVALGDVVHEDEVGGFHMWNDGREGVYVVRLSSALRDSARGKKKESVMTMSLEKSRLGKEL